MKQVHRVRREPVAPIVFPKDQRDGPLFTEADGTVMESTWNGYDPIPQRIKDWPEGIDKDRSVPANIHIPKRRM